MSQTLQQLLKSVESERNDRFLRDALILEAARLLFGSGSRSTEAQKAMLPRRIVALADAIMAESAKAAT